MINFPRAARYCTTRHNVPVVMTNADVRIPTNRGERVCQQRTQSVLDKFEGQLAISSRSMIGYQLNYNLQTKPIDTFLKYHINNVGDAWKPAIIKNNALPFEKAVVEFFADLWRLPLNDTWGYITSGSSEALLYTLWLARKQFPAGILFTSAESHFAVHKAAAILGYKCCVIDCQVNGEMNYDHLTEQIRTHTDSPIVINATIGTTFKGAYDNVGMIIKILHALRVPRDRYFIVCDGAMGGSVLPFWSDMPSFDHPIDALVTSGHKQLGCPLPCGIVVTRKKQQKLFQNKISYLDSMIDNTISCSRSGHAALYLWYTLRTIGMGGMEDMVRDNIDRANYLHQCLLAQGVRSWLGEISNTVVFEIPLDRKLILKWQLSTTGEMAHIICMPHVSHAIIDEFMHDYMQSRFVYGVIEPEKTISDLLQTAC
jgi:histidine decarboxylase